MTCPACQSEDCRRSRRRYVEDHVLGFVGVLPWRCNACHTRFHARPIPLRHLVYARCGMCGNLELQHIAAEKVPGATSLLWRILGVPALRCDPCRHKFFSLRPVRRSEEPEKITAENRAAKL